MEKITYIFNLLLHGEEVQIEGINYKLDLRSSPVSCQGLYKKINNGKGNGIEECWELDNISLSAFARLCKRVSDHSVYLHAKDEIFKSQGAVEE